MKRKAAPQKKRRYKKQEEKPVTAQPVGEFVAPGGYYRRFPTNRD